MTPLSITAGQIVMVVVYVLLTLTWAIVCAFALFLIIFRQQAIHSREIKRLQISFLSVAAILSFDAFYWAITNTCHVFAPQIEAAVLRQPWLIAAVKSLSLIIAGVFALILWKTYQTLFDQFEAEYFRILVDQTSDAIGILDENGRVSVWNRGAEKIFGWPKSEVTGRHIKEFLVPERLHDDLDKTLAEIKSTLNPVRNARTSRRTSEGTEIPIDVTITPIVEEEEFRGYFGIMRPIPQIVGTWYPFGSPQKLVHESYVFIAMPTDQKLVPPSVRDAIRQTVAKHNMKAILAEEDWHPVVIPNQIVSFIWYANVVIADLTGHNPNVLYEFGLTHALGKPFIQIINKESKLPFDLAAIRTVEYDLSQLEKLQDRIDKTLTALMRA